MTIPGTMQETVLWPVQTLIKQALHASAFDQIDPPSVHSFVALQRAPRVSARRAYQHIPIPFKQPYILLRGALKFDYAATAQPTSFAGRPWSRTHTG